MPQTSPLDSRWTRHLEPDQIEKFKQALLNDTLVLGRLYAILEEIQDKYNRLDMSEKDFDTPNWEYRTAFRNGQKSQLNEIKALISFIRD